MITRNEAVQALRQSIADGEWEDRLPPISKLHAQLGCSRETVEAALRTLIVERVVVKRGRRHYLVSADEVDADALTARRVFLIEGLYSTGMTRTTFGRLLPTDQHKLAGASGARGYAMMQLAVDTLRSPAQHVVRASLGHHEATRGAETLTARREAFAGQTRLSMERLRRAERRGAYELAGHLESLQVLRDQGLLTHLVSAQVISLRDATTQLADLERRTARLEGSTGGRPVADITVVCQSSRG